MRKNQRYVILSLNESVQEQLREPGSSNSTEAMGACTAPGPGTKDHLAFTGKWLRGTRICGLSECNKVIIGSLRLSKDSTNC